MFVTVCHSKLDLKFRLQDRPQRDFRALIFEVRGLDFPADFFGTLFFFAGLASTWFGTGSATCFSSRCLVPFSFVHSHIRTPSFSVGGVETEDEMIGAYENYCAELGWLVLSNLGSLAQLTNVKQM
jgi:hypothetical protein